MTMIRTMAVLFAFIWAGSSLAVAQDYVLNPVTPMVGGAAASSSNPLPIAPSAYPSGAVPITGNASGSTAAVVGSLTAASGKTTYICGFNVVAVGGTAPVGPITVAGIVGSSQTYQMNSAAAPVMLSQSFNPCLPASAVNTAISITTTANATATAVNVNSWGYRQ